MDPYIENQIGTPKKSPCNYIPNFRIEINKIGNTSAVDYYIYDDNPNNPFLKRNLILSGGTNKVGPIARITYTDVYLEGVLVWNINFLKCGIPLDEIEKLYDQYVNEYELQIKELVKTERNNL